MLSRTKTEFYTSELIKIPELKVNGRRGTCSRTDKRTK